MQISHAVVNVYLMSLFYWLACTGWAWSKQGLKNTYNVILFLKVLLDWVTTKSKVWTIPEKINIFSGIVSDNSWQCVAVSNTTGSQSLSFQTVRQVEEWWQSPAVWTAPFQALRSSAPLKSLKPTTQQTTFVNKRLQHTLLHWISYKKLSWLIFWYRCNFCQEGELILDMPHRTGVIFTDSFCRSLTPKTSTCYFQNIIWSLWIARIKSLWACWLFYLGKEAVEEIIFNIFFFNLWEATKFCFSSQKRPQINRGIYLLAIQRTFRQCFNSKIHFL